MIWFSRVLLLLSYCLYWGGLTFYTGFVVRIAHDVLDDPMTGGIITQRSTALLQILGVVTVILMVCNCVVVVRLSPKYGYALIACAAVLSCSLIGLFIVHGHLDAIIDVGASEITDRDAFVTGHRRYNQLTTVQWLAALAYLPITVFAWRSIDAGRDPVLRQ
ncbi:MAG: hypothetical protein QGF59_11015 [Pirellulaceae bacterium]|jgi:hypothetical protein|nr:hypothetical protein [Pirellulaceae bacterium]